MTHLPEGYKPPTPGISEAWKFQRSFEARNLNAARYHAHRVVEMEDVDLETKQHVMQRLAELDLDTQTESDDTRKHAPHKKLGLGMRILKNPSKAPGFTDYVSASSDEKQFKAFEAILQAVKNGNDEKALEIFSQLPYRVDRAKVLCSLIPEKGGGPSNTRNSTTKAKQVAARARESLATIRIPKIRRAALFRNLFKTYFEKTVV